MHRGLRGILSFFFISIFTIVLVFGFQGCSSAPEEDTTTGAGFGAEDLSGLGVIALEFLTAASTIFHSGDSGLGFPLLDGGNLFDLCPGEDSNVSGELFFDNLFCDLIPQEMWGGLGGLGDLLNAGQGNVLNFDNFQGVLDGIPFTVNGTMVQAEGEEGDLGESISTGLTFIFCIVEEAHAVHGDGDLPEPEIPELPAAAGDGDGDSMDCQGFLEEINLDGLLQICEETLCGGEINLQDLDFSFLCQFNNEAISDLLGGTGLFDQICETGEEPAP